MTLRLAVRSLVSRPVRSAVLVCGFGFGIAVMAELLGVGDVMLEQATTSALVGGGDLLVSGAGGSVSSARFVLQQILGAPGLASRAAAASPSTTERLFLIQPGRTTPVTVRGGIPSLERAVGDSETRAIDRWADEPADRAWTSPEPADLLREMDRFHGIPDVASRAGSWAEWLYFNGRTGGARFYLTFLAGPRIAPGRRAAFVRLQLERNGSIASYSERSEVSESEISEHAPDLEIGASRVRLERLTYRIVLHLLPEGRGVSPPLGGEITLEGTPGRSVPPFTIYGAGGWQTGYTVPVLSGRLGGALRLGGEVVPLEGGVGYHDHNWGFWEGVTWEWGQVAGDELSVLYGRVRPPPDAADPDRIPGFLAVLGPDGPLAFSASVSIAKSGTREDGAPARIEVHGRGTGLDLRMDLDVESAERTRTGGQGPGAKGVATDFLQLRARYHVSGRVGERAVAFEAPGSAETFRER